MSALTLAAVLVALFLIATWLGGALILGVWRVAWTCKALRPILERSVPLAMAMPIAASITFTLAAALPAGLACHCGSGATAPLHLCFVHPEQSASLAPIAVVLLLVFAGRLALRLPALLRRVRASLVLGRGGRVINEVAAPIGNAFSLAFPRPRIVVDRAWWRGLRVRDRRIVLAHECAHLRRGDPLLLELLNGLALGLPELLATRALGAWREHAERQADAAAARAVGDPIAVASLLVELHRRAPASGALGVAFQDGHRLEARVRALIAGHATVLASPDLDPRSWFLVAGVAALPVAAAQRVHTLVETLLGVVS